MEIGEFIINTICIIAFTSVGIYAILEYLKMNMEVKKSIIRKNDRT